MEEGQGEGDRMPAAAGCLRSLDQCAHEWSCAEAGEVTESSDPPHPSPLPSGRGSRTGRAISISLRASAAYDELRGCLLQARSLVAQRRDRIEARGLARGIEAEEHADGAGEQERDDDRRRRQERRPGRRCTRSVAPRRLRAATPTKPPTMLSITASTRNCSRMWRLLAPTAMRMPISRVRSVTETSRMFMMPMPPTSSEIEATLSSRLVITLLALSEALAMSLRLRTVKSSSWPDWMWWRWCRSAVISCAGLGDVLARHRRGEDHVDAADELRCPARGARRSRTG